MELFILDTLRKWREDRQISREKFAKMSDSTTMTIFRAETTGKINLINYIKIHKTVVAFDKASQGV